MPCETIQLEGSGIHLDICFLRVPELLAVLKGNQKENHRAISGVQIRKEELPISPKMFGVQFSCLGMCLLFGSISFGFL